ncbi:MAG TPA: hypothetical protein VFK38_03005, partial [Candidatus Limnocylindrales bacterium]|nr:hypothetical protein [Candidatus Limnocylindrales bacterium]
MDLLDWGWSDALEAGFAGHRAAGLQPARVIGEQRGGYRVVTAQGEADAVLAGRLRYETEGRDALPAVGDWVAVEAAEGRTLVRAVLPRRSRFARLATDRTSDGQVVAANVDT